MKLRLEFPPLRSVIVGRFESAYVPGLIRSSVEQSRKSKSTNIIRSVPAEPVSLPTNHRGVDGLSRSSVCIHAICKKKQDDVETKSSEQLLRLSSSRHEGARHGPTLDCHVEDRFTSPVARYCDSGQRTPTSLMFSSCSSKSNN